METNNVLPNEQQRSWLIELMYQAFLEMRLLGWDNKAKQCADLADAFHNLPYEMYDPKNWSWERQRYLLNAYCEKYKGSRPAPFNYGKSIELISEGVNPK